MSDPAPDEFRFLARHLVAIGLTYRLRREGASGTVRFIAYSGTLIHIRHAVFVLTAGHCVADLEDHLANPEIEIVGSVLVDTFGLLATSEQPIPFDIKGAPRFYIDDVAAGLDFGVIAVHPHFVRLLGLHGMVAIGEENWARQHAVEMDAHFLLGLPAELTEGVVDVEGHVSVGPSLVRLKKRSIDTDDVPQTLHPRFVAEIAGHFGLTSLRGMSGGPIIGFDKDRKRYWIVAIQSAWLKERRIVFGCPVPLLGRLMTEWTDQTIAANPDSFAEAGQNPLQGL